ncbi:MAG: dynamin family protein, partial [Sciscionella sp.]|nr:dynamin family protein [Sciscionella sp.]
MAAPTQQSLPQVVRQTRDSMVSLLAKGEPDAAKWVESVRASKPSKPTMVVVGETNRGKSSLVNALLTAPGLSPVDAEVATATYLVFNYGERLAARACYPGQHDPVPFDPNELVRWVSAAHELPEGQLPPRYVEIEVPAQLASKVSIVDTPGVGGLDSMHGELAREATAAATALLFVVDASAPFTSGELSFLRDLSDRVETVVFALAKTDAYRGWRQIMEADKQLLAEHAPRLAGAKFHPVSARMFEMSYKAPNEQAVDMLRQRSGIADLQKELEQMVSGRSAMLHEANTMRALSTALAGYRKKLEASERALSSGEDEAENLRKRREELVHERRTSTRGWSLKLRTELQRARLDMNQGVTRQIRELQSWFQKAIKAADKEKLQGLPSEVDAALQMVSGRVSMELSQQFNKLIEAALSEVFSKEELDEFRMQLIRGERQPIQLRALEKRTSSAEDKLMVSMGAYSGLGTGRMVGQMFSGIGGTAAAGMLNPFTLVPTLVIGLGASWWIAKTRKQQQEKQHLNTWLTEAIAEARSTLDRLVAEQFIDAEQQMNLALQEAIDARIESIEAEVREVDKALKLEVGERNKRLAEAKKKLADVQAGQDRVEKLLGSIRALRD